MEAIKIHDIVKRDGEIHLAGLPIKKGQRVEMIVLVGQGPDERPKKQVCGLLGSGLVGLWEGHGIDDPMAYARELRQQAQKRNSHDLG
jgi:hypothetical protein